MLGAWITRVAVVLIGSAVPLAQGQAQTESRLRQQDQVRIAEADRLADQLADRVWPGWGRTPMAILLVSDSAEYLISHPRPSRDFMSLGYDSIVQSEVKARPRQFPPTLLATFPAVGGLPTIVIGTAERTGKSSTEWVLTLLHEHFHQWQYSRPGYYEGVNHLGLAGGDTTGSWMLEYRFPYDSVPVQQAMRDLASALLRAVDDSAGTGVAEVIKARDNLRRRVGAADYRYFEFQLWQEGVARYIQYAAARAAAKLPPPSPAFRRLADYQPYQLAAKCGMVNLRRELETLDLARQRRVAFYPIGAAIAMVLDRSAPDWKQGYTRHPFELAVLLGRRQ